MDSDELKNEREKEALGKKEIYWKAKSDECEAKIKEFRKKTINDDNTFGSCLLAFDSYCKLHTRSKKAHFAPLVHNILFCPLLHRSGQKKTITFSSHNRSKKGEKRACVTKNIFNVVLESLKQKQKNCIFIDGPGGRGKSYLLSILIDYLKFYDIPFLCVAWTGIAANLLKNEKQYIPHLNYL